MTNTTPTSIVRLYRDYNQPAWKRIFLTREMAVVASLIVVTIVATLYVRGFGSPLTFNYLMLDMTPILLIALPMTLIIITGEIDLSVASVVGLASVVTGVLHAGGMPFELAAVIALIVGAVGGAINGFLVTVVGLPSLAVTIGTLALYRGLAIGLLGTTAVTDFPAFWKGLAKASIPGTQVPVVILLVLVLALVFVVLLHFTPFGRGVFALGQSSEAASFSGVNVNKTKFILFVLAGAMSALAGIYYTLRFGSARGDNATGLELQVIAAVLLGGVSIFGGRGKIYGVMAGVLLIGILASALRLANVTSDVINIITGVLLVASVVSTSFSAWLRTRKPKSKGRKRLQVSTANG